MGEPVEVRVTREMIAWALQQSTSNCAIALGLRDASWDFARPMVRQDVIRVTDRATDRRYTFNTPEQLSKWIDRFDRGLPVKPITFTLDLDHADKSEPIKHPTMARVVKLIEKKRNTKVRPAREATISPTKRPLR